MKLLKKLRAIFNFKGQKAEMQLESAEIRGNKLFLHPADDPKHTFCVSGKAVDILIDPAVALTEDDFFIIDNEKVSTLQKQMEIDPTSPIEKLLQTQPQKEGKQSQETKKDAKQASNKEKDQSGTEAPKKAADTKQEQKPDAKTDPNSPDKKVVEKTSVMKPNVTYMRPQMRTISMRLYQDEYDQLMEAIEEKGYKKTEYLLTCVAYAANKKTVETNYQKYYAQRMRRKKEQRDAAKRAAEELANQNNQEAVIS